MFDYVGSFEHALGGLKREQRYRFFIELEREAARFPHALWNSPSGKRDVVIWCSNDYLGMGQHPKVIEAMCAAARSMGAGAGGTRNISGTSRAVVEPGIRTRGPAWKRGGTRIHIWLCLEPNGNRNNCEAAAGLSDPFRRAQPQFHDRGRARSGL